ncbi:MAG: hypothetical protein ACKOAL_12755 [Chthoniobacterales bacterium]
MHIGPLLEAALEVQTYLEEHQARFCFIGGVAVQRWGEPRFTKDADLNLLTGFVEDEKWTDLLLGKFEARYPGAREFALQRRVLLVRSKNGTDLDISLGGLPFEKNCIGRASRWLFADGRYLLTCSAEDLVVHKAFANRPLDWVDIEGVIMRQGPGLKTAQIFGELQPLAELKEEPEIVTRLKVLLRKRNQS